MFLLRSLFPQPCYMSEDGGGIQAPAASAPSSEGSTDTGTSAPTDTAVSVDVGGEPDAKPPSLEEQLDSIWDKSHTPRDEAGRFKSTKPVEGEEPPGDTELPAEGRETTEDQPADEGTTDPNEATVPMPQSWSKDKAEVWSSLTPAAREIIAARETEVTQALSRAGRAVNTLKNVTPLLEAVEPYRDYLHQVGQHVGKAPTQLVNDVLRFEHTLRTAPTNDKKIEVLSDIIHEYGIDVTSLIGPDAARAIGQRQPAAQDPRVDQLAGQVQQLTQHLTAQQRAQAEAAEAEVQDAIGKFSADAKSYPHFQTVRQLMGQIMSTEPDDPSKSYLDLMKDAYEKAIYAHPVTREAALAERDAKQRREQQTKAAQRGSQAQRAASANVRSGVASTPKRTMDDDLGAIADKHYR